MSDCMNFPNNWRTFLNDYSFKDTNEIYTNGAILIPTFRVEQLIEHYFSAQEPISIQKKLIEVAGLQTWYWACGNCDQTVPFNVNFCPWCGKAMKWE